MPSKTRKLSEEPIFRALASKGRLCIVKELGDGREKCVCDLVECCGLSWSTVSHHLAILRAAGIVAGEKRGTRIFCRLVMPCVTHFLECLAEPSVIPRAAKAACRR